MCGLNQKDHLVTKIGDTLQYDRPVILVGPADFNFGLFQMLSDQGYAIIAADGGANRLYNANIMPDAIIGDLDSLENEENFGSNTKIIHFKEQETTDFEKCLYCVDAPVFLAIGFTGKRLDHTLANTHTITKFHKTKYVLLIASDDVSFVWHGAFSSPVATQTTVSVFPLMPIRFSHSEGLMFELNNLKMEIGQFVSISNRTIDSRFSIIPTDAHSDTPYLITLSSKKLNEMINSCLRIPSKNPN
ncbi:MAG: thiamine diphosphokinase [Hyphomicrobiales bacterium]|nr:thiamine diphosphokinase [Hyphomicrobiales bacterium]